VVVDTDSTGTFVVVNPTTYHAITAMTAHRRYKSLLWP